MDDMTIDELADLLNADFGPWASQLTPNERHGLLSYQEGWSEMVNNYLRDHLEPSLLEWEQAAELEQIVDGIESAVAAGSLQRRVTAYRGISEHTRAFDGQDPATLMGEGWSDPAFLSTTIDREIAVAEFVKEPDPALFELDLAVGCPAAWLEIVGGTIYHHEREILLPAGTVVILREVVHDDTGLLVVKAEVMPE